MRDHIYTDTPKHSSFSHRKEEISSSIQLFPDSLLLKGMQKAAESEEFEIALVYINELTRRGKL